MSRIVLLLGAVLLVSSCASQQAVDGAAAAGPMRGNPCTKKAGSTDRNAPIVCVDDTGSALTVAPDPIRVHDVGASDRQPVVLHWHTVSGSNDLQIEIEPGCVTEMRCDGKGHCMARSLPRGDDRTEKRCKYDVWTDRHPRLDPDVIIVPCC
jgi:hypothetical protein